MMTAATRRLGRQSSRTARVLLCVACIVSAIGPAVDPAILAAAEPEPDAWNQLRALRDRLAREPVSADFVQTFLPAGFSTGDEEGGVLHLSIPDCLRWDYRLPYPKSYLVCGQEAYTWNEGELQGRRFFLESDSEPGLDFLRLQIDNLRSRYTAKSTTLDGTVLEIVFTPLDPDHTLVEARVVLDTETHLLSRLSYDDLEGNRTRFDISGYRPISGSRPFDLPQDLEWLEQ